MSKTLMLGERWYQQRTWMIGAYSTDPFDVPPRTASTPSGPQPSTAWFSCKNLSDKAPINLNLTTLCYQAHSNATDRPNLPTTCSSNGLSIADLPFGSFHPGGANFAYGDGGVKFLADDIAIPIYLALGSRNGGEVTSE
jgi:prepilin-type processing-associated H-X9-DG protein